MYRYKATDIFHCVKLIEAIHALDTALVARCHVAALCPKHVVAINTMTPPK